MRRSAPIAARTTWSDVAAVDCNGDRVLVQKFLYDFRRPRRWEVAVFHFPQEPTQAYVKRVVGLPGESVQLSSGDVYIDGKIARKSSQELRRRCEFWSTIGRFVPKDSNRFPRWVFLTGDLPGVLVERLDPGR